MKIVSGIYNKFIFRPVIKRKLKYGGKHLRIGYSSELINPGYFSIGDNFFSGPYGYFVTNRNNPVTIGKHVMFGPFVKIIGGNHDFRFKENHMIFNSAIDHLKSEIVIEDGAWIGSGTIILSGAYISEGAVIGAMSLVNKTIPPYSVCAGTPARPLKPRFASKTDLEQLLKNVSSKYSIEMINEQYLKSGLPVY